MSHEFVTAVWFWRVKRCAGVAHVLRAMKDSKGQTVEEVSGREIAGDWSQRKAADFLQETGNVFQLRNLVGGEVHRLLQHAPIF